MDETNTDRGAAVPGGRTRQEVAKRATSARNAVDSWLAKAADNDLEHLQVHVEWLKLIYAALDDAVGALASSSLGLPVEGLRAVFTNEVIRAIGSLSRQQNVCREQGGVAVFVTGMEAAREYIVEHLLASASVSPPAPQWRPIAKEDKHGQTLLVYDSAYSQSKVPAVWDSDPEEEGGQCWRAADAYADRLSPTHVMSLNDLPDPPASSSPKESE